MKTSRLFQLICCTVLLFKQIENVLVSNNNLYNILLMKYTRNPYTDEHQVPDIISIILNEQLIRALNRQQQPITDVQNLYNEALSKMSQQIPEQDLVILLWKIYKGYDVENFITMTRAQLALYWRYKLNRIQDPHYVLLAAHCFYKIKHDVFFTRLPESTQLLLDSTLKSLPSSLQYLYGKQEFCLYNKTQSEVMYQTTDHQINGDTSLVLTSTPTKVSTDYMGMLEPIFEATIEDNLYDLNLVLVSKHFRSYYHRLPEYENRIGANETKGVLKNFLWSVDLVDDNQLTFRQEEFFMCRQAGGVYALKEKTIYDGECQWIAGEC